VVINTNADARAALLQLASDITNTETTQVPQIGLGTGVLGYLGINQPGSSETQAAALSLLDQLANTVMSTYGQLDDSETPLTTQQIAQMQLIQKQVIDARGEIGLAISDVDWSLGGIFDDAIVNAENYATQAISAVSKAVGINWTFVAIGVGAILIFVAWRKVA
jgi:hypothetical protein